MGVETATRARVRADIVRLLHRGVDLPDSSHTVGRTLQRAVPFDGVCLLTVDPATMLPTGEVVENGLPPSARVRMTEIELGEPDFNKFTDLARAAVPAASLSAATGGELDRSRRQREVRRPNGFADELRTVLTGPTGSWGNLTLLREARRPHFSDADVRFVASLAGALADGVRRTALHGTDVDDGRTDTGFLVVAADDTRRDGERRRISVDRGAVDHRIDRPPRCRSPSAPSSPRPGAWPPVSAGELATARVRTRRGRWAVVRGSLVGADRVAVLIEAARPAELAIGDRRHARLHRTRTDDHRAGRPRSADEGDLQPAAPVGVHRAGPPQVDLRQDRDQFPWRARGQVVPRPPRAATDWMLQTTRNQTSQ